MNDSRVADVYSGEDLVEVLCREAVEAAAVGQQLVELLDGHLAAAAAGSRRDISRWLLLLFSRTQVLLHGSLSPRLPLDDRRLHDRPAAQLHLTFARESCARCLVVYKVSDEARAPLFTTNGKCARVLKRSSGPYFQNKIDR